MPRYQFFERHEARVSAPPDVVYETLWTADLGRHPLVRALLAARSLPARMASLGRARPVSRLQDGGPLTLRIMLGRGFILLDALPEEEVVIGLTGRFWTLQGGILPSDPASFRGEPPPGTARVVTNFALQAFEEGTHLSTQTRILCADRAARRAFALYWLAIRPGSGLIRRAWLATLRRQAERSRDAPRADP